MDSRQKEYLWISIMTGFYILTGAMGIYDVSQIVLWPIFAIPMSLLLIKTKQKEAIGFIGVMLCVIISIISTGGLNLIVISGFLLFILVPAFVVGILYCKETNISKIIIVTTTVMFLDSIIFLAIASFSGVDYLDVYFSSLDAFQSSWNATIRDMKAQNLLPEIEDAEKVYAQVMGQAILQAKRTYPATLFIGSLVTSSLHLFMIQLVARMRSWKRPDIKEMVNVSLSPVSVWIFIGLWIIGPKIGGDGIWLFAAESMVSILLTLFQIMGLMSMIVLVMKINTKKLFRTLLIVMGVLSFVFNPILLVVIGCLDSLFNFRKVETLI